MKIIRTYRNITVFKRKIIVLSRRIRKHTNLNRTTVVLIIHVDLAGTVQMADWKDNKQKRKEND